MDIRRPDGMYPGSYRSDGSGRLSSVVLRTGTGTPIEIDPDQIKKLCKKFAGIAKELGETGNEDEYADDMFTSIYGAYEEVEKRQKKKRAGN